MASLSSFERGTNWYEDQVLKHIVKKYCRSDVSIDDLKKDQVIKSMTTTSVPNTVVKSTKKTVDASSKAKKALSPTNPDKCQCRVWNHGYGGQCSFKKTSDTEFCKRHSVKNPDCGLITEPRPETVTSGDGKVLTWNDAKP